MNVFRPLFKDRSLGYKFVLLSVTPVVIVTIFIVLFIINALEKSLIEKTITQVRGLTRLSALSMSNPFVIYNKDLLDNFVDNLAKEKNIIYAMIIDSHDGRVLSHSDHENDGKIPDDSITSGTLIKNQTELQLIVGQEQEKVHEISAPVIVTGVNYGFVRLGFSLEAVYKEIAVRKTRITTIAMIAMMLAGISSVLVARIISQPIKALAEQSARIGSGDFEQRITYESRDSLGQLAHSFNRMAEQLRTNMSMLRENEAKYRALFEYSPISLWEEDLSQVKRYIDGLRDKGVKDLKAYFDDHPEEITPCINMIRIQDVNRATLTLYEADSKENFLDRLREIRTEKTHKILIEEGVIALAEGRPVEIECVYRTLGGREITVLVKAAIPPGYENTWSKAFVSVQDLTERVRAEFLEKMFGRYLSQEVVATMIENPDAVRLGGEKRQLTIMMTDLRGFTALSERLKPEEVVQMLNTYFEVMVDVVLQYNGTISEIIGDSLLIIFGAPQQIPDRAQRAIACAIAMQNAMAQVREENLAQGLPELEMGIGLNDAEVIVGNIGSKKRSKYGVVGGGVNMTSRIESYTVGGQILVSESVRKEAGELLRIDGQMEVHPKGAEAPFMVYQVGGIGGRYNLTLEDKTLRLLVLAREIPIRYIALDGKYTGQGEFTGAILRLSRRSGQLRLQIPLEPFTNLKFNLLEVAEELSRRDFYGKVVGCSDIEPDICSVRFTALPPGIDGYFQATLDQGARQGITSQ
jgi:class 3 adenylate cyclase/HAMP domain-containing protein